VRACLCVCVRVCEVYTSLWVTVGKDVHAPKHGVVALAKQGSESPVLQ